MKISKWLISLLAVFSVVFFFACSDNGKGGVSGGELGNDPEAKEAIDDLPNNFVTRQNLDEFIVELEGALDNYFYEYWESKNNNARGTRAENPDEYAKETEKGNSNYKIYGNFTGRCELVSSYDYTWQYSENGGETESGYSNYSVKFFDFSNSGTLFLGGAVETHDKPSSQKIENGYSEIEQFNGTVEFAGEFAGKIVFDNISVLDTYFYEDSNERDKYEITGGSFYVESNGDKITLPVELLRNFYVYSDIYDYGDGKITILMPDVPTAPNGNLTGRGGVAVNSNNSTDFFRAFKDEFYNNGQEPRAANEETESWESLEHGDFNGYYIGKYNEKSQANNTGEYWSGTETIEYQDYSNNGLLFFGGGVGIANYGEYQYTGSSETDMYKTIINGKVKFNGDFTGTLDFQNFYYKHESNYSSSGSTNTYTHMDGKIMIDSYDVTDEYFRYIIKGENIGDGTHTHNWVWRTAEEPTCDSDGLEYEYCTICGEVGDYRVIPQLTGSECDGTHTHNWIWVIGEEPTCDSDGLEYEYCTICGEVGDSRIIPQLTGSECDGNIKLEGDIDPELVGTWLAEEEDQGDIVQMYLVLNADGTGNEYYYYNDMLEESYVIRWYVENGIIYAPYYDSGEWYEYDHGEYYVSGNSLMLYDYGLYGLEFSKYDGNLPTPEISSVNAKKANSSGKSMRAKFRLKK